MENSLSPKAQKLVRFLQAQGYVCPWGRAWHDLWRMLPGKEQKGAGWKPPLPLILSGWYASGDLDKWLTLNEHIRWADEHGAIDRVNAYLRNLGVEHWHRWKNSAAPGADQ